MPAEFIKCVDALIKSGKPKDSAYAICTWQYKKRHKGHTPQQDEKASDLMDVSEILEDIETMGWFYEVFKQLQQLKESEKDGN